MWAVATFLLLYTLNSFFFFATGKIANAKTHKQDSIFKPHFL